MAPPRKVSRHPLAKAWGAALAFIGHLLLCALLVTGVWGLDRYMSYLWDHQNSMLFDKSLGDISLIPWMERFLLFLVSGEFWKHTRSFEDA